MNFFHKPRARCNRTVVLDEDELATLKLSILTQEQLGISVPIDRIVCGDSFSVLTKMPTASVDLLLLDPPYNLNKQFSAIHFCKQSVSKYSNYLQLILSACWPLLKPTASVYICGDWYSSVSIFEVASSYFRVRNRITWEREKGRGASTNWKNSSEDIWFCTVSDDYYFNVNAVKLRRKVLAPYRNHKGHPKDWFESATGKFRDTYPSNLWSDISIPFWSMPENTDHPTQKSEKLFAKLILASSQPGDLVLDPFLGSGTSAVVAKKLGRHFLGIEIDEYYALLSAKRLALAEQQRNIQGYSNGIFWERNASRHSCRNSH